MDNFENSINHITVDLGGYLHISCYFGDKLLGEYRIKKKYASDFVNLLEDSRDTLLSLGNPLSASIFLEKDIATEWLHDSPHQSSIDPLDLLVKYIANGDNSGYLVSDNLNKVLSGREVISDAELIFLLASHISFMNRRDKISLLQINGENFFSTRGEYASLCRLVRKKYGLIKVNPIALDDFVYESSMAFFKNFTHGKKLAESKVNQMAYLAETDWQFMKSITMILDESSAGENVIYQRDGYVAILRGTLKNPHVVISCFSYNMVIHGYEPNRLTTQNLFTIKGEDFWREVRYEYARKHEESLGFKRDFRESDNIEPAKIGMKCSDKYSMTLGEIQLMLKEKYGVEVTESAIGLTVKRALGKIESNFAKIGIDEEDYNTIAKAYIASI